MRAGLFFFRAGPDLPMGGLSPRRECRGDEIFRAFCGTQFAGFRTGCFWGKWGFVKVKKGAQPVFRGKKRVPGSPQKMGGFYKESFERFLKRF